MKKFTLIVVAMVIATGAFAQKKPVSDVQYGSVQYGNSQRSVSQRGDSHFGVKGGLNFASETNGEGSTGSRTGIHIGLFNESTIAPKTDFQIELLYSMQGAEDSSGTEKVDYITLPLIFKFYTGQGRRFSIDVGPQFGYMLSCKYEYDNGTVLDAYDSDAVKKFDASLGFGISYKFNQNFDLGLRFLAGMTNIYDGLEHKNSVVQLGVGYRF